MYVHLRLVVGSSTPLNRRLYELRWVMLIRLGQPMPQIASWLNKRVEKLLVNEFTYAAIN